MAEITTEMELRQKILDAQIYLLNRKDEFEPKHYDQLMQILKRPTGDNKNFPDSNSTDEDFFELKNTLKNLMED